MGAVATRQTIEFERPSQTAESPADKHPLCHRIDFAVHRKTR